MRDELRAFARLFGTLGDVHRLVADALEVGDQLESGGEEPQIVRDRLA